MTIKEEYFIATENSLYIRKGEIAKLLIVDGLAHLQIVRQVKEGNIISGCTVYMPLNKVTMDKFKKLDIEPEKPIKVKKQTDEYKQAIKLKEQEENNDY